MMNRALIRKFPCHYYCTQLQEARQEDGESPAHFLDRIKALIAKKREN
jgi:hypothetical protein